MKPDTLNDHADQSAVLDTSDRSAQLNASLQLAEANHQIQNIRAHYNSLKASHDRRQVRNNRLRRVGGIK